MVHAATTGPFFGLTPELLELQAEVRAFAVERLRPRARELEWEPQPADRVAWDLLDEASARGWRTIGLPPEAGGRGASALALAVLVDEHGEAHVAVGELLDQCLKVQRILYELATG